MHWSHNYVITYNYNSQSLTLPHNILVIARELTDTQLILLCMASVEVLHSYMHNNIIHVL